jgi:hypothetical protein
MVQKEIYLCRTEQRIFEVLTMNLQKALISPEFTSFMVYYKTNMYTYNFVIHCFNGNDAGYMDM